MSAERKPGLSETIKSFPSTFWVANTMEIFERMAWYGFFALSSLYITGPVETGGLGFTSEQRGQLQAIGPFILYLLPVITGALADRYGYKRMFIIAYVGMAISYYSLGQFTTFPTFLAAFLGVALFAAIFKPVVVGTVARVTDEKNSSMGFGIFYMMVNVGGFIGPFIAGAVRGVSWKYVFIACAAWSSINLIIVLLFYKEPTSEAGSTQKRTLGKVARDMVEVLGNVRFLLTVFTILIALMLANQGLSWFSWHRCRYFIVIWLAANLLWDLLMPKGSGNPKNPASTNRPFFLKRMHCSNWRFAVYLLIMSGFWTSFQQIFITMPEYIRDYAETKPAVNGFKSLFKWVGKEQWIDAMAAIEETEVLAKLDELARRSRGIPSMVDAAAEANQESEKHEFAGLTPEDHAELARQASELNRLGATSPIVPRDLIEASATMLQYKVRITPIELGRLLLGVPAAHAQISDAELDVAVKTINKRLDARSKAQVTETQEQPLRENLRALLATTSFPNAEAMNRAAGELKARSLDVEPGILALGVRDLAYRPTAWSRIEGGRQVNAEHIVNLDALSIVLLQILISYIMAKFHRFTTMIVGMVVAAAGIALSALAGGTMIGPTGALIGIVVAGLVVFAIGEMMASPTSQEYVGRIAPKERVAVYMGYYFIAVAMGNLFGGILSGQLYGKLARDMQRPDLMWLAFGGIMLATALLFVVYDRFAVPRSASTRPQPA